MKRIAPLILTLFLLSPVRADESSVSRVLDDFHQAASQADGTRYFGHFSEHGVFLGTDIKERWNVEAFKEYAMPYFSQGRGWTYRPQTRHVYLSSDGKTAWFDEILHNDKFGLTRGSGVLQREEGTWKISQYHLTLPVPNELIQELVKMMETRENSAKP